MSTSSRRETAGIWMKKLGFEGVLISTTDNFSWITSGGNNMVIMDSEVGIGHIVITKGHHYLISMYMDADRLLDDHVPVQDYKLITTYWNEGGERNHALKIAGKEVGADTAFPGTEYINRQIIDLQWPLSDLEKRSKLCHILI